MSNEFSVQGARITTPNVVWDLTSEPVYQGRDFQSGREIWRANAIVVRYLRKDAAGVETWLAGGKVVNVRLDAPEVLAWQMAGGRLAGGEVLHGAGV